MPLEKAEKQPHPFIPIKNVWKARERLFDFIQHKVIPKLDIHHGKFYDIGQEIITEIIPGEKHSILALFQENESIRGDSNKMISRFLQYYPQAEQDYIDDLRPLVLKLASPKSPLPIQTKTQLKRQLDAYTSIAEGHLGVKIAKNAPWHSI